MSGDPGPMPEFSRPVSVSRLRGVAEYRIDASAEECTALARRFGLLAVERLGADVVLAPAPGGVRLTATLEAEIVQECVVTLDPLRGAVSDRFTILYAESAGEVEPIATGDDDEAVVEPLPADEIDLGEAVAQQLSLALDPFPRIPGAALPDLDDVPTLAERPFAVLSRPE